LLTFREHAVFSGFEWSGGLKKPFLPATEFRMFPFIAGHALFRRVAVSIGRVISPSPRADHGASRRAFK
jgi:hypothetical protein